MRKALIFGVILAAGLFTLNVAYAGKNSKEVSYGNTVQKHYTIKKSDVIWNWDGNAWMKTDAM